MPDSLPEEWRADWTAEAERHGQAPLPATMIDPAGLASREPQQVIDANRRTADRALRQALELLGAGG